MADDSLFSIRLVTPERILVDGVAAEVVLRTAEGDVTFLAGHTPLVGTVEPGIVRVVGADGEIARFASHGGFVQVEHGVHLSEQEDGTPVASSGTRVTLLIGVAEPVDEIDVERATAALEAADARLAELAAGRGVSDGEESDADVVEAEAARRRAQVRLEATDAGAPTLAAP